MFNRFINQFSSILDKFQWLAPLVTRVVVGFVFAQAGWGKLQNLDRVVGYFQSLGIPQPQLQAPFVAGLELVGGVMLIVGLLTRFISIPLIGVMAVAFMTALAPKVTGIGALFGMSEFLYVVLLFGLVVRGGGKISLDHMLIERR